jgi:molybdopterin synthase sulfur carrier subunit
VGTGFPPGQSGKVMVKVQVWGSLKPAIGGEDSVEVEGETINDLLKALSEQYPGMAEAVRRGVSVTVNGEMYANAVMVPVKPDDEVFILPKLVGG